MPFRIENILKRDETCASCNKPDREKQERSLKSTKSESILQQTLLNRLHPYYYTYRPATETAIMGNLPPPSYECERLCYPPPFYSPYVPNDFSYAYGRKYYSIYNMPAPAIYAGPYNVYAYSKRKGGQVRFTPNQTDILEKRFMANQYLSPEDRKRLADNLKLSDRQVKTWFQNRRAKWRRIASGTTSETPNDCEKRNGDKEKEQFINTIVPTK